MIFVHENSPVLAHSLLPVSVELGAAPVASPPAAGGAGAVDLGSGDVAGLSPDALMAYCQARLDSIDGQFNQLVADQSKRNGEATNLQQVIATFQKYAGGVDKNDSDKTGKCLDMETALSNYIAQIKATDPNFPDLGKLEQTFNELLYTGTGPQTDPPLDYIDEGTYPYDSKAPGPDSALSSDEAQGFLQSLQGVGSDLNSGAELQMIQIQSLMSQRQTAVELTTNLVQSLGGQSEKIAENIGH
jgi:hypothetical protein